MNIPPKKQISKRAFTLVELLMVMAIMLVIMGLIVANYPSLGKAGSLTNGAASFVDLLNQARQTALSQNRSVEVRFYYLPGPTDGTKATAYRAMRIIVCDSTGNTSTNASSKTVYNTGAQPGIVQRLPTAVIVYSDTAGTFTTLLPAMSGASSGSPPTASWPSTVTTTLRPTYGTEYFPGFGTIVPVAYAAFQFKPTGGTTLDPLGTTSDKWFMSFKLETDPVLGTTQPAKNFLTLLIDPVNGRVRTFRP